MRPFTFGGMFEVDRGASALITLGTPGSSRLAARSGRGHHHAREHRCPERTRHLRSRTSFITCLPARITLASPHP